MSFCYEEKSWKMGNRVKNMIQKNTCLLVDEVIQNLNGVKTLLFGLQTVIPVKRSNEMQTHLQCKRKPQEHINAHWAAVVT